jgi:hypothetical protein
MQPTKHAPRFQVGCLTVAQSRAPNRERPMRKMHLELILSGTLYFKNSKIIFRVSINSEKNIHIDYDVYYKNAKSQS